MAFSIRRRELTLTLRRLCNRSGYQGFYVTFSEMRYRNRCFSFALGVGGDLLWKIPTDLF